MQKWPGRVRHFLDVSACPRVQKEPDPNRFLGEKRRIGRSRRAGGFTLAELNIGVLLLGVGALALLGVSTSALHTLEGARNLGQATEEARTLLEKMRQTADNDGLLGVRTAYPEGTDLAETLGLDTLSEQEVTVDYADPAADPLDVTVQIQWRERARTRQIRVETLLTDRTP